MKIDVLAEFPPDEIAALEREVSTHMSLVDALRWSAAQEPGRTMADAVADVVVQDEYTHDVVVRWRGGAALVYDAT